MKTDTLIPLRPTTRAVKTALSGSTASRLICSGALIPLLCLGTASNLSAAQAGLSLGSLTGQNGFTVQGASAFDELGRSVASIGDINGDGIDDLLVGAPGVYRNYQYDNAGGAYVVFGGPSTGANGILPVSSLDGTNGFTLQGASPYDFAGYSVAGGQDVNGDGFDDLIVGAPFADPLNDYYDRGSAYVVFGGSNVGSGGSIDLVQLNGTDGFEVRGIDVYDRAAVSVDLTSDVNGDGFADLIVGANFAGPGYDNSGESYVVFGSLTIGASGAVDVSTLDGTDGFVITGAGSNDRSGTSVADAGDFNGDGVTDLVVGAPAADVDNSSNYLGATYVVFGGAGLGLSGQLDLNQLNANDGLIIAGDVPSESFGRATDGNSDVNGDGFSDILIGNPAGYVTNSGVYGGTAYIVFGGTQVGTNGVLEVSSLDGANGFRIAAEASSDALGSSIAGLSDINGDGTDDFIVGAPQAAVAGDNGNGVSYVLFGGTSVGSSGVVDLGQLSITDGFVLNGVNADDQSGFSVGDAGDLNGDGVNDIVIGAPAHDSGTITESGAAYIVFMPAVLTTETCKGEIVTVNLAAGDVPTPNSDVILGTPTADIIDGLGGNDIICGDGGDDQIAGGEGNDVIYGGTGKDTLHGGDGDDEIFGEPGDDTIDGQEGNDAIRGGGGNDAIAGGVGNDTLFGQGGADIINGGDDSDILFGGTGDDEMNGGAGSDTIRGQGGADTIDGESGYDTIYGGPGNDFILAGTGGATVFGGSNNDTIMGSSVSDFLNGNAGLDVIMAGAGLDTVSGGLGADQLFGGDSNDTISGGGANDIIDGGQGVDIIFGGLGDDNIDGGDNADQCDGQGGVDTAINCETLTNIP